jgi:hypothetical protein
MKVSSYQRRTPPRDQCVQVNMSMEEARHVSKALEVGFNYCTHEEVKTARALCAQLDKEMEKCAS